MTDTPVDIGKLREELAEWSASSTQWAKDARGEELVRVMPAVLDELERFREDNAANSDALQTAINAEHRIAELESQRDELQAVVLRLREACREALKLHAALEAWDRLFAHNSTASPDTEEA